MRQPLVISFLVATLYSDLNGQSMHAPSIVAEDPACYSYYVGPPDGSVMRADYWSHGVPRATDIACFPQDAAALADAWPGIVRITVSTLIAGTDSVSEIASGPNPPNPTDTGGCCLGSSCINTDYFECMNLGGYFRADIFDCDVLNPCTIGACCGSDEVCIDEDLDGGPMYEEICTLTNGTYVGGAACDESDPCQRYRIPERYEIIQITPQAPDLMWHDTGFNDCGEAIYVPDFVWKITSDLYLYDNGTIRQVTDDDTPDGPADINNIGSIATARGSCGCQGTAEETYLLSHGETKLLGRGDNPSINDLGHVAWDLYSPEPPTFPSSIWLFDGQLTSKVFDDGLSNQTTSINEHSDVTWARYDWASQETWVSDILYLRAGTSSSLPATADTPQRPHIDNHVRVGWGSFDLLEVWQEGVGTTELADGHEPSLNDAGDVSFNAKTPTTWWRVYSYRNGQFYDISLPTDPYDNGNTRINATGEIIWVRDLGAIRMMRRIRNGDVTFDGIVDIDDFIPLPGCWTGPGETDGLCECRFYDIDHDRDIDNDDFALFMRVYSGPQDDCNNNGILDLTDLIEGTSTDCNLNGIPDLCDLTADPSADLDGDGMLDVCCIAPTVSLDEIGARNRTITVITDPSVSQLAAPEGFTFIRHAPLAIYALRVTLNNLPAGFEAYQGTTMWATAPFEACENSGNDLATPTAECGPAPGLGGLTFWGAQLTCNPALAHYMDWSALGSVHLYHETIVPGGTYSVQSILEGCGVGYEGNYSAANSLPTSAWGDVVQDVTQCPPGAANGTVDIVGDVVSIINKFSNTSCAASKSRADLEPGTPDFLINITDAVQTLRAFTGVGYPFLPEAPPCQ